MVLNKRNRKLGILRNFIFFNLNSAFPTIIWISPPCVEEIKSRLSISSVAALQQTRRSIVLIDEITKLSCYFATISLLAIVVLPSRTRVSWGFPRSSILPLRHSFIVFNFRKVFKIVISGILFVNNNRCTRLIRWDVVYFFVLWLLSFLEPVR